MKKLEYYSASWCSPCKMLKPIMQELKDNGLNIEMIDIEQNPKMSSKNNVKSVPTIIIYKDNKEFERFVGFRSKAEIVYFMSE